MNSFQLLRIKIRITCTPVWNKLTVIHTFKIPPDTQHYFGVKPILFNDDFRKLTGTKPLFRDVRVAVIYSFLIICDNFPGKSVIHGITDKVTTDIHSNVRLLRCQFVRYRSTASVWTCNCLYLAMLGTFWCTKLFWQPTSTFCGFSSKILRIFPKSNTII